MPTAGPNLPRQLLLHKAAPTTSHYLLVQTCLCQKLCFFSLESLSSICTTLPASFDSFISDRHITVEGHERRKIDKLSQLYSSTDVLEQTRESMAQERNHQAMLFTVHSSGRHRDDQILGCTEAPQPTILLMWIYVNELIIKPSAYNLQYWHRPSWQLHIY